MTESTMHQVNCLYCGKKIPDDTAACPHCGAVSHYQKRGYRSGTKRKFVLFFIALVVFCFFFMFWLPR
ncbi:MAG: zinc-ribbon domain-containing protein [Candidatus Sedimenticola sp. (ex Thyasira tokunagai)]